jgi:hypothetical protein
MPHEEQAARWYSALQDRFYKLHAAADSVTMLSTQYTEDCYSEAEDFMLEHCSHFITDDDGATFTRNAEEMGKNIELLKLTIRN